MATSTLPPHLEQRAVAHERDAFNRKYPPGSRLKLLLGRYGSVLEIEVKAPGAFVLSTPVASLVLINVHDICHVFMKDVDFGPGGAP